MSFKLLGINFYVSAFFALIVTALLFTDKTGLMSASLFAVVMHEAGHITAMKITRSAPESIRLCPSGILIVGRSFLTFRESIFVSLSGPAVNIILFSLLYPLGILTKSPVILSNSGVELIFGLLNLMPVKGLDGGTVLRMILEKNLKHGSLIFKTVSVMFSLLLFIIGTAVAVNSTSNLSLLLLALYLIILNVIKS